jgi:DNA repair exonuclease SbcCD nuclease subunit
VKILVTSDWHLDWVTNGFSRLDDLTLSVRETVRAAIEQKVDAYCFTGDLMDPDSGPRCFHGLTLAIEAALDLSERGIPSYWMAGNHDVIEDGQGRSTLAPLSALNTRVSPQHSAPIEVIEKPGYVTRGNVRLLFLPFTSSSHAYDPVKSASKALDPAVFLVTMGHLQIEGITPGEETTDMSRGRDIRFPREVFKDQPGILINGHYHRQQVFDGIHIPGALQRLTHGEEGHAPGYLIIEVPHGS